MFTEEGHRIVSVSCPYIGNLGITLKLHNRQHKSPGKCIVIHHVDYGHQNCTLDILSHLVLTIYAAPQTLRNQEPTMKRRRIGKSNDGNQRLSYICLTKSKMAKRYVESQPQSKKHVYVALAFKNNHSFGQININLKSAIRHTPSKEGTFTKEK